MYELAETDRLLMAEALRKMAAAIEAAAGGITTASEAPRRLANMLDQSESVLLREPPADGSTPQED
jgi:hypothetical protein